MVSRIILMSSDHWQPNKTGSAAEIENHDYGDSDTDNEEEANQKETKMPGKIHSHSYFGSACQH